jgi:hypothetical protein
MDSETFINSSSPEKSRTLKLEDYEKPKYSKYELFKSEVRSKINPNLKKSNTYVFALPKSWYDLINKFSKVKAPLAKKKYSQLKLDIKNYAFPQHSKHYKIIKIEPILKNNIFKGFSSWLDFYEISNNLKSCNCNKLYFIHAIILNYLTNSKIEKMPFMMIVSHSKLTIRKIRSIHSKIKLKLKERTINTKPLFTIQIQDVSNPYILLWLDSENLSSFNLMHLESPRSTCNFANTLMLYINYAIGDL